MASALKVPSNRASISEIRLSISKMPQLKNEASSRPSTRRTWNATSQFHPSEMYSSNGPSTRVGYNFEGFLASVTSEDQERLAALGHPAKTAVGAGPASGGRGPV